MDPESGARMPSGRLTGIVSTRPEESAALAKDLKRRGFRFVGPTTMYSLMQATGMVNDHMTDCPCHGRVAALAG